LEISRRRPPGRLRAATFDELLDIATQTDSDVADAVRVGLRTIKRIAEPSLEEWIRSREIVEALTDLSYELDRALIRGKAKYNWGYLTETGAALVAAVHASSERLD